MCGRVDTTSLSKGFGETIVDTENPNLPLNAFEW